MHLVINLCVCVFHWANGDRYEGEFLKGKKFGHGVYYFNSGNIFEGRFVDDDPYGDGCFYEVMHDNERECAVTGGTITTQAVLSDSSDNNTIINKSDNNDNNNNIDNNINSNNNKPAVNSFRKFEPNRKYFEIKGYWDHGRLTDWSSLNPLILDCINRRVCTFSVTNKRQYGQPYYKLEEKRTDEKCSLQLGVCVVCAETCIPRNNSNPSNTPLRIEVKEKFGGNFFCYCGYNPESTHQCFALHESQSLNDDVNHSSDSMNSLNGISTSLSRLSISR